MVATRATGLHHLKVQVSSIFRHANLGLKNGKVARGLCNCEYMQFISAILRFNITCMQSRLRVSMFNLIVLTKVQLR